ncbi:unnamed protein product [Brassicogethes aeneus]|uniref:Regulatory protein zeste n=1 Tax=Brassicogethes aeneus TaxID=1431903 RepID=A0A9P0AZZ3_BRAAE|nr:unnamed protein product [Brassicogethes aeneus]
MKSSDSFANGFKKLYPRQIFAIENVHDKIKRVVHLAAPHVVPGAKKDWKNWRKTWQDLKSRTKNKAGNIKKHARGTGGGPPCLETMTLVEDEVLEVIKAVSVEGHQQSKESHTEFNFYMSDGDGDGEFNMSNDEFVLPMPSLPVPSTSTAPVPPTLTIPLQKPLKSKESLIIPKKTALSHTLKAVADFRASMESKAEAKKSYQEKKLALLERKVEAKERSVEVKERIAAALEAIAESIA